MRSPGINGEGELRGQPANPGSPGKMAVRTECVCCVPTLMITCSTLWCVLPGRLVITAPLRSRSNRDISGCSTRFVNWQRTSVAWRSVQLDESCHRVACFTFSNPFWCQMVHSVITLHAKLSSIVYCNRSCLWVYVFAAGSVCGSVTTITRNCVHRSSPN